MTDRKPKRVLLVESGEGVGGSAFSLYRVIKYLDKTEFLPEVFVYHRSEAFERIAALGVSVTQLPARNLFPTRILNESSVFHRLRNFVCLYGNLIADCLTNGVRLANHIRRHNIAIVHCNNGFFENFSAVFAARLARTPCVSHVRGTEPILRIERVFRRWLSHAIVLNRMMLDAYSEVFGSERTSLIYNGVDIDLFGDRDPLKVRSEFGVGTHEFCVGTFARIVEGKGIPEFLEAAAKSRQSGSHLRFFVVGEMDQDPEFSEQMRDLAVTLGLRSQVTFTGWRNDVQDVMSAMDLILQVSTSYPEGMSLAPIEAMALSKAVVVTDNPGYEDIVEHGRSGYVVGCGDVDSLSELIATLSNDRELVCKLGSNAHQRVLNTFEYRIVVRKVEAVYRKVLGTPPGVQRAIEPA